MLTLGIETSTNVTSVAILDDDVVLAEQNLSSDNVRHAQTLVHDLNELLEQHQLQLSDCKRVAVSMGPGSFTGLRIGLVFAKTLSYINQCELVPVDTLLAIAANSPDDVSRVHSVVDAQRGDLYVATFDRISANKWKRAGDVRIVAATGWMDELTKEDVISGPGLQRYQELISEHARVLDQNFWTPRAAIVARLDTEQAALTRFEDLAALEPFYLRKSAAEENWARKQATR
ncbi:tRNA threonylcarbamoyladenosine biosynthesis protein TsaB [Polystyrenella longa]|uniref:tRNA threonylcarbamoyladenosine biosynthesis protein TsaB n=1 Tax=Polystyrenella longa TaxID=2528007 RepID=A0A518CPV3_9PLAN|nr:tRNA (adenosine(37)-N6)-threonylcarbamoyltransferase complex dimerization subunit type 1 TsaB [Polystyrenella longa]QDU81256.1 tRNA threonylcarbamoyladenosine biosynthesis protein TsaB [Polystyrenella longa]